MLNLEDFDKLIMRTREHTLDFHMSEMEYAKLVDHCDVAEKPFPKAPGPDYEFVYFGVLCQIYITKS